MKSKFKLTFALLVLTTMFVSAAGSEYTKNIRKAWAKGSVTALKVTNKFGEIKINDLGGDSVTIKVVITVDNSSENRAKYLMDKIEIEFQKTGGLASAETRNVETRIEEGTTRQSFTIDYLINIPKDRDLDITNKYGNVIVNNLEAKGTFNVSYGNLTAGNLKSPSGSPINIAISYGKADIETINNANMEFKYAGLNIGEINQLVLVSKYSQTINLHKIAHLTLDSKYDAINIDEVDNVKAESKYTNYKIGLVGKNFELNTEYGSVRISKMDSKFDEIKIQNSYGGINIGLNELSYKLKADCSYCDVNYPSDRYKGNRINDNQHFSLDGNVGTGGGSVSITSRYGGVKLTE